MATEPLAAAPDQALEVDEALGELLIARGRLDAAGLGRALRVRETKPRAPAPAAAASSAWCRSATSPRRWRGCSTCRSPARPTIRTCRCTATGSAPTSSSRRASCRWPRRRTASRSRWPTRSTATRSARCSCSRASRCCPGSACRPTSRPRSSACSAAAARSARSCRRSATRASSAPRTTSSACAISRARRRSCASSTG